MKSEKWLPPSILAGAVAGFLALNGIPFLDTKADTVPAIAEPAISMVEEAAPSPEGAESDLSAESLPEVGSAPPAGDEPIMFEEMQEAVGEGRKASIMTMWTPDVVMRSTVSMMVMLASFFVLLSKRYGAETIKWAVGALAVVVGYWL